MNSIPNKTTHKGHVSLIASFALFGSALLLAAISLKSSPTATCNVPADHATIQGAVDDGTCTVINVAAGTYNEHVTISRDVTIVGAGTANTIVDGTNNGRVFTIESGTVVLNDLTVQHGLAPQGATGPDCFNDGCDESAGRGGNGGGILNSGTLTLNRVTISNNKGGQGGQGGDLNCTGKDSDCNTTGGDGGDGGGIFTSGALTISSSIFEMNQSGAGGAAGAIHCMAASCTAGVGSNGDSGALGFDANHSTANIDHTSFSNNSALDGGAITQVAATLTITNSTFTGNHGTESGGAISCNSGADACTISGSTFNGNHVDGVFGAGALSFFNDGTKTVTNCTFVNNTTGASGGAIRNISASSVTLDFITISGNTASNGAGGIVGTVTVRNSIVANNTGGNCAGSITDGGYNIDSANTCGFSAANNSKINTDPQLDPAGPQSNGGPTQTIALQSSSMAIDAIPNGTNGCGSTVTTDQRTVPRPADGNNDTIIACDMGAYELAFDPTGAAALVVTTTRDVVLADAKISLREAITTANNQSGADTITFNIPASDNGCTAANACTITLGAALPAINDDTTIDGLPNNGHITVDGNSSVRGFLINAGHTVNLQNLAVANGRANDCPGFPASFSCGGAIFMSGGTVNVANVTINANSAITSSAFAIGGGMFMNDGTLNVTNSTFTGNVAQQGAGINSNLGTLNVTNSTFFGNSGISFAGGIFVATSLTLKNSIVANNPGGDCLGTGITADSFNIDSDGTCGNATTKTAAEINLQPLADNGGPTMTMALALPSAAVDTGDNTVAAAPPVNNLDQRGSPRPTDGDNNTTFVADVGAFELQPSNVCQVCHKHVTLTLPCNSLEYHRHLDHGDPPNACPPTGPAKRN